MSANFDELIDFPTNFTFRIIAYANDTILERCVEALKKVFGAVLQSQSTPSSSGRFLRIHIMVLARTGEELYAGYDALKEVSDIKMVI